MSRIGIRPVEIVNNVTVEITPTKLDIKGPLGSLSVEIPHGITVKQKESHLIVERIGDSKLYRSLHGTIRNLLRNAIVGVSSGFEKKLDMVGIGYRGALEGNDLVLQVGYTHPVRLTIPSDLKVKMEKNTIIVSGFDKHAVGQFSANVRAVRVPDPYKGKGIRYQGEKIRMKQGKATKGA